MSEQIKDGGAAFPVESASWQGHGATLRDYFAAKELSKADGADICDIPEAYARLADHCYRMADAMLAAREVKS